MAPKIHTIILLGTILYLIIVQLRLTYFRHDVLKYTSQVDENHLNEVTGSNLQATTPTISTSSTSPKEHVVEKSSHHQHDINDKELENLIEVLTCAQGSSSNNDVCIDPSVLERATSGEKPWLCRTMCHYILETKEKHNFYTLTPTEESLVAMELEANQVAALCDGQISTQHNTQSITRDIGETVPTKAVRRIRNVVAVALHDGLGNQMFQVACGMLLAEDLGKMSHGTSSSRKVTHMSKSEISQPMSSVMLLDEPTSYREIFSPKLRSFSDISQKKEKYKSRRLETGDSSRRRLKENVKRSDGATALLRALYPNMEKHILSADHLSSSLKSSSSSSSSSHFEQDKFSRYEDSLRCLEAIKELNEKGCSSLDTSLVPCNTLNEKGGATNNETNNRLKNHLKSSKNQNEKVSIHSFTDIDRLWRSSNGRPGLKGFIHQLETSPWAFGPIDGSTADDDAVAGTTSRVNTAGGDWEVRNSDRDDSLDELRCIIVDGFFQKPFIY